MGGGYHFAKKTSIQHWVPAKCFKIIDIKMFEKLEFLYWLNISLMKEVTSQLQMKGCNSALSREGSLSCHTCYDTGPQFTGLIRKVALYSRLIRQALGTKDFSDPDPHQLTRGQWKENECSIWIRPCLINKSCSFDNVELHLGICCSFLW